MKPVSPLKKLGVLGLGFVFLASTFQTHGSREVRIFWQTWDQLSWGTDPAGSTQKLSGLDADGTNKASLYQGSDGESSNGDLIEIGYFGNPTTYAPNTDTSNPFKGTWIPLVNTTTIGHKPASVGESTAGEFFFSTAFNRDGSNDGKAISNDSQSAPYKIEDSVSYLDGASGAIEQLDDASGVQPLIGIRFYDVSPSANTGGTTKANGTTRYNTVMDAAWAWVDTANLGSPSLTIGLHESGGSLDSSVQFEFANTSANAASKIGKQDNAIVGDDYVATVTYYDGSSGLTLNDSGIGSAVLSGLTGSGTITDSGDGNVLTLHTAAGNTGADAFTFSGTITGDTTVLKTGTGEQKLTGAAGLNVTDSTGFVNVLEGTLNLSHSGATATHSMDYLLGAAGSTLKIDNEDQTVNLTLGLSVTGGTYGIFSGDIQMSGTDSTDSTTITVSSGTTDPDYGKVQILDGVISGSGKIVKDGVGRLKLNGQNTFSGGVEINNGTVVVNHADALGTGTTTINNGKLKINETFTVDETIQGGTSSSDRSFIGGDGTVSAVTIGSASGAVDVVTPGEGITSSLNLHNKQAVRGKAFHTTGAGASIGTFTSTTLSLLNGGVYDWEISNFDGTGTAGTDWDLLNFDTLNLGAKSDTFNINVYGIIPDAGGSGTAGEAGAPKDEDGATASLWSRGGTKFKFLDGGGGSTVNWTGGSEWTTSELTSYFQVRDDDLAYHTNMWGGDWTVTYESNAFYLNFSAVPEPSTYVMVTGLLALPGLQFLRRLKKKKGDKEG